MMPRQTFINRVNCSGSFSMSMRTENPRTALRVRESMSLANCLGMPEDINVSSQAASMEKRVCRVNWCVSRRRRRVAYLGSEELSRRDRSFCLGAGLCNVPERRCPVCFGSLEFDIDTFFDDFDGERLQRNRTRHTGGLATGHVEGAEMPGAFDDL